MYEQYRTRNCSGNPKTIAVVGEKQASFVYTTLRHMLSLTTAIFSIK